MRVRKRRKGRGLRLGLTAVLATAFAAVLLYGCLTDGDRRYLIEKAFEEKGSGIAAGPVFDVITIKRTASWQERLKKEDEAAAEGLSVQQAPVIRIVLDPGHGGPGRSEAQELGAVFRGTCEKLLTLKIAEAAKAELEQYGNIEVFMTRTDDRLLTLKERAAYAESVDGDLLVSLHLNASKEHNFFGSEVFVSAFGTDYTVGAGVGKEILEALEDYGFVSKGVKTRLGSRGADYYGIIRETVALGIPAVLVEHGYMDEDRDWARMDTDEELARLGQLDGEAIAAYFGLEKGRATENLGPEEQPPIPEEAVLPDTTPPQEVWFSLEAYDEERGIQQVAMHALEKESQVLYYCFSTDGGQSFAPLELWPGGEDCQAEVYVSPGEAQQLQLKVYNTYELEAEAVRRD